MKGRFILELDPRDSLESNLKFLKDCERDIEKRRQRLLELNAKPAKKEKYDNTLNHDDRAFE